MSNLILHMVFMDENDTRCNHGSAADTKLGPSLEQKNNTAPSSACGCMRPRGNLTQPTTTNEGYVDDSCALLFVGAGARLVGLAEVSDVARCTRAYVTTAFWKDLQLAFSWPSVGPQLALQLALSWLLRFPTQILSRVKMFNRFNY